MKTPLFPLELIEIGKNFGAVRALRGVSLTVQAGECIALLGENGAGKSTLMKILAGNEQPSQGEIRIDGDEVRLSSAKMAAQSGIHLCHQELQFVPGMSVLENLELGTERTTLGVLRRSHSYLDEVTKSLRQLGFHRSLTTLMGALSVADRQLIAVAKGLRPDVQLVILDEPTAALAPREVDRVGQLVKRLTASGKSVIYISHRLDEIQNVADRAMVLRDGEMVGEVAPSAPQREVVRLMVGREISNLYPHTRRDPGEEVLRLEELTAAGIADVNLTVRAGEVVGIGGLVGSGQTALARTVYGVHVVDSGTMTLDGKAFRPKNTRQAIVGGVGYLGEDRRNEGMVYTHSIFDNIALPAIKKTTPYGVVLHRQLAAMVRGLADQTRIKTPSLGRPMSTLSGGNQQKAVLSRALITEPKLLVLLEPTRGVDVGARADIYELLDTLTERGTAILLISSDMPELIGLSDRIAVMYKGRITGELRGTQITADAIGELATGQSGERNE